MDIEGPQEPQEEAPAVPEAPVLDPIQLAAQQLGVDPNVLVDSVRMQEENRRVYEENRRRGREIELERAKVDALRSERERYQPQRNNYDDIDPVTRRVLERMDEIQRDIQEDRNKREEERQNQIHAQEQGAVLHSHYTGLMRGVPTQNQIPPEDFFDTMAQIYPGGIPDGVNPQQAVNVVAKYLGIQSNGIVPQTGYVTPRTNPLRDPRASITVPVGSTGGGTGNPGVADVGPQRPGETLEQYSQRLGRVLQDAGIRSLAEGQKVSSG